MAGIYGLGGVEAHNAQEVEDGGGFTASDTCAKESWFESSVGCILISPITQAKPGWPSGWPGSSDEKEKAVIIADESRPPLTSLFNFCRRSETRSAFGLAWE